jgi:hypothetical protein
MPDVLRHAGTELYLRLSDCTLRVGRGSRGRPALEVYSGYRLIDVAVAGALDPIVLRGALRSRRGQPAWALAWGVLGGDGEPPRVEFRRRGFAVRAPATVFGEHFWASTVPGAYRTITIGATDAAPATTERLTRMRPTEV